MPKEPVICRGSFASPEAVAHIATQKFVMYSPLYRLEQEFNRQGLKLSRQTMSNWLLHASDRWLQPIYEVLHQQLRQEKVLHGDETTLQVLRESGKVATRKSYMWLYRTSGCAEHLIVLYEPTKPNGRKRRGVSVRLLRWASCGRIPRVSQTSGTNPGDGLMGARPKEIR
jgi:hypothetical protein